MPFPLDPFWLAATIALCLLGVLGGVGLATFVARVRKRLAGRRHQRGGARSERRAERLLSREGFTILERHPEARWSLWVDGRRVDVRSQADLLVRRRGKRFVAEVKAGVHGTDPTKAATRRQLLEYARAFDVDGLVFVDMRSERIHLIAFQQP